MTPRVPVLAAPAVLAWLIAWCVTLDTPYRRASEPLFPWVGDVRDAFRERTSAWGGDAGALVPSLVLGDTDAVSESLAEAMRVTSLTHLMAVSGSNCAIVVAVAFGIAALLGASLVIRVAVAAAALTLFVIVVGPEPSIIRASIMAIIGLGALLWGRPIAGTAVLSATIIIALAFEPTLSRSLGFTLSVAATLGLLTIAPILTRRWEAKMPKAVAIALAIPVSAAIACQPIILSIAPFVPLFGVVANILAEPFVPVATVSGLLTIVLPIPVLSDGLLALATLCAAAIAAIARFFSSLPMARLPWPPGVLGVTLGVGVSAGIVIALRRRTTRAGIVASVLTATLGLSLTLGGGRLTWATAPANWSWAQCDVGQGDAVFVRDAGVIALIDTGRSEAPLRECLATLGISHIDLLVLTHFDLDHVGGYRAVLGKVGSVIHGPTDGPEDERTLRELSEGGATVTEVEIGMTGNLGRLQWRVLWPDPNIPRDPGNPSSVVLVLDRGPTCDATCVTGIDWGDLPADEQAFVRRAGRLTPVDVGKVSHHGSRDQDAEANRLARPSVALIGVGADNEYGHPTAETLDLFAGLGSTTLRSDRHGVVLVWRNPNGELRVWRERQSEGRFTLNTEE